MSWPVEHQTVQVRVGQRPGSVPIEGGIKGRARIADGVQFPAIGAEDVVSKLSEATQRHIVEQSGRCTEAVPNAANADTSLSGDGPVRHPGRAIPSQ